MPLMCMRDCLVFWVKEDILRLFWHFVFGFGLDSDQSLGYERGGSTLSRLLTAICKSPSSSPYSLPQKEV